MTPHDNEQIEFAQEKEHFCAYSKLSNIPPVEHWPTESPVIVTGSCRAPEIEYEVAHTALARQEKTTNCSRPTYIPTDGSVIQFQGPLFEGCIVQRLKELPVSTAHPTKLAAVQPSSGNDVSDRKQRVNCETYFKGRSRHFQWTVQGVFKERVRFDEMVTGQDFDRPFRNPPAMKLVDQALVLLKTKLPDTFECELAVDKPRFEHPLVSGCQSFRVEELTAEINAARTRGHSLIGENEKGEVEEDTRLLGNDVPREGDKRRKYFSRKRNAEKYYFEPGLLYTFDFYCNFFSPPKYSLELSPLFRPDVAPYFNGYPLFMSMAKDKRTGKYFWATELWHKRLLDIEEKPKTMSRFFSFGRGGSKPIAEKTKKTFKKPGFRQQMSSPL